VLTGTEIKSIRAGKVSLSRSPTPASTAARPGWSARTSQPWDTGNRYNHEPKRPRKLLLHRDQILALLMALGTGPVGMRGFDRGRLPENASRGWTPGLVKRSPKEVTGNNQSALALAA
jgi:hypothetical protein